MNPGYADVIGLVALVHETIMLHIRALFNHNLGDSVVEISVVAKAHIALDHGSFRFGSRHYQDARMGDEAVLLSRNKGQMYWSFHCSPTGNVNDCAVADEGGIERGKAVILNGCQSAEMLLNECAVLSNCTG